MEEMECFLTSCMHLSIQLMLLVVAPGMGVQNQAQGNLDSPSTLQEQGLVCSFALRAWNGSLTCIRGHSAHDRFSLHCAQGSEAFWSQDIWIYKWWWCVCVLCLCNTWTARKLKDAHCHVAVIVTCQVLSAVKHGVRLLKSTCCESRSTKSGIGLSSCSLPHKLASEGLDFVCAEVVLQVLIK